MNESITVLSASYHDKRIAAHVEPHYAPYRPPRVYFTKPTDFVLGSVRLADLPRKCRQARVDHIQGVIVSHVEATCELCLGRMEDYSGLAPVVCDGCRSAVRVDAWR